MITDGHHAGCAQVGPAGGVVPAAPQPGSGRSARLAPWLARA